MIRQVEGQEDVMEPTRHKCPSAFRKALPMVDEGELRFEVGECRQRKCLHLLQCFKKGGSWHVSDSVISLPVGALNELINLLHEIRTELNDGPYVRDIGEDEDISW